MLIAIALGKRFCRDITMRVMLIGEESQRLATLRLGLAKAGCVIVAKLANTQRLLAELGKSSTDLIVIEMVAPDVSTLEQLRLVKLQHPCPVVMFTRCSETQMTAATLKAGVNSYIVDGLEQARVKSIIEVAVARFNETQALHRELDKANLDLQERKHIERAKGILMKRNKVDEDVAYKTLRKMAMDRNKRVGEVAESIITAEEFLTQ